MMETLLLGFLQQLRIAAMKFGGLSQLNHEHSVPGLAPFTIPLDWFNSVQVNHWPPLGVLHLGPEYHNLHVVLSLQFSLTSILAPQSEKSEAQMYPR